MDLTTKLNEYQDLLEAEADTGNSQASRHSASKPKDKMIEPNPTNSSPDTMSPSSCGLATEDALLRLHQDMDIEISKMRQEFSSRRFVSTLLESISFGSELSKMRWPSVIFMTTQAIAHFIVEFILDVDNPATNWVGFQGFILLTLLILNLSVNLWDTKLRLSELLMKSERLSSLIKQCSQDKPLLRQWQLDQSDATKTKTLFIPRSPSIHQTLTYRDNICLNLPDYLLVRGDIIHLYPGDRSPADCVSLEEFSKTTNDKTDNLVDKSADKRIRLNMGQIFRWDLTANKEQTQHDNQRAVNKNAADNRPSSQGEAELNRISIDKRKLIMQFDHAKLKKSHNGANFVILSTPYIKSLRMSLQRSHQRPVNSVEKECFIITRKYFETFVIPMVFSLSTLITAIHYGYLDFADSDHKIKTISIAYLLLRPSLTIMPFLPWMFPCFWMSVNAFGSARLLCCAESQRKTLSGKGSKQSSGSSRPSSEHNLPRVENLLATPNTHGGSETRTEEEELHDLRSNIRFMDVFWVFVDLIQGKGGHVWRSSSLLQVLGCLTSLSCIDKVGILSWPNPTPEKVFILTEEQDSDGQHHNDLNAMNNHGHDNDSRGLQRHSSESQLGDHNSPNPENQDQRESEQLAPNGGHNRYKKYQFRPEVLDVSQNSSFGRDHASRSAIVNQQHQHCLQFDDPHWTKYTSNLKPLGLAIMLNNCCEDSFDDYFKFYKHISYESLLRCNLTPVVKRRCICDLSKLIGFTRQAVQKNYKFERQIGIYKLIDSAPFRKGKFASSLESSIQVKLPFPNMTCNLHQDKTTGSRQMFIQGTADILLDACIEFWDGKQLVPLDESARKKIMDFYHRTSLTSYCCGFSYAPTMDIEHTRIGPNYFVELSPEYSRHAPSLGRLLSEYQDEFLANQRFNQAKQKDKSLKICSSKEYNPMNSSSDEDAESIDSDLVAPHRTKPIDRSEAVNRSKEFKTRRHLSAEDLSQTVTEEEQSADKDARKSHNFREMLDELTDQVFVGMVSMQYQACADFVALVEQLEHACIRFIHFSKENELRSRVFSEKMGLESGWNCHVSLQSDQIIDDCSDQQEKSESKITERMILQASKSPTLSPTKLNKVKRNVDEEISLDSSISAGQNSKLSWRSLPSLVMQLSAKLIFERSQNHHQHSSHHKNDVVIQGGGQLIFEGVTVPVDHSNELAGGSEIGGDQIDDRSAASSEKDDAGFESLVFDMSNRAKLPKGIHEIRPHLENIDNIPLQVSLFTDCTPDLTKEMIEIMQDYGEIVCVLGSSSSALNTPVFLQANASVAIEPLEAQNCMRSAEIESPKLAQRKLSRARRKRRHIAKKRRAEDEKASKYASAVSNGQVISPTTRSNKPRDRLGMNSTANEVHRPVKVIPLRQVDSTIRSSSSSSSGDQTNSNSTTSDSSEDSYCSSSSSDSDSETSGAKSQRNDLDSSELLGEFPSATALASKLASLPCCYTYSRKDPVNLYSLIMEARHFTFKMKNTFVCMICFALSISSAQFLASILFLPPILSSGLTIWLTIIVVPLMSLALMSTTMDSQVMKIAVGKNLQLKPQNITFFVICYLIKFIPSIIVVVLSFGLIIAHSCKLTGFGSSSLGPCWMFTYVQHGNTTSSDEPGDLLWSAHLYTAQVSAASLMVLYFVVISSGFVHRSHLMWQRSPTQNRFWVLISVCLLIGQLFYNKLILNVNLNSSEVPYEFLASLPLHIWIISFAWPIIAIAINLLVKRAEIKATIRQQRRARFDFNTKLGMNSPF